MDWTTFLTLQVVFQPSLVAALFTVDAAQSAYTSEFGGDVVMGCSFRPVPTNVNSGLQVSWDWIKVGMRRVYAIENGVERPVHRTFQGRAVLLTDELRTGWAKLQLSKLQISDSGTYRCVITADEGADYKQMSLSVVAPYRKVTKTITRAAEGDAAVLTCQSDGYPETAVLWQDGHQRALKSNTTSTRTPEQLYRVSSQIRVDLSEKNNYTCVFTNDGHSAIFHLPDDMPTPKNDSLVVALCVGVTVAVVVAIALVFLCRVQKGSNTVSTRDLVASGANRLISAVTCQQKNKGNEEETAEFNEASTKP